MQLYLYRNVSYVSIKNEYKMFTHLKNASIMNEYERYIKEFIGECSENLLSLYLLTLICTDV
jgi:hypothetical protein